MNFSEFVWSGLLAEGANGELSPVVLAVGAVLILALLIVLIVMTSRLVRSLVTRRFSFHDFKEVDRETGVERFSIVVANRSLNDIAVSAMGVVSGLKYFDFQKNYRERNRMSEDGKPVIPPRTAIQLNIDMAELQDLIFAAQEKKKLSKTYVYVIDASGNVSKVRARNFHRILKAAYAERLRQQKEQAKRDGFESAREAIRASEAEGVHVGFGERIRLVFAKFPSEPKPAAEKKTEPVPEQEYEEPAAEAELPEQELPEKPDDLEEPEREEERE